MATQTQHSRPRPGRSNSLQRMLELERQCVVSAWKRVCVVPLYQAFVFSPHRILPPFAPLAPFSSLYLPLPDLIPRAHPDPAITPSQPLPQVDRGGIRNSYGLLVCIRVHAPVSAGGNIHV